ncbi:GH1 family beta-glucosidase [Goodfellowiella coeruleoviolacea]|uniref:GH1 family beta-glucosidase n=1 Tax=Goodfellowiella coeruleoviolacea TaxID=334858 RepID=UPI0020A5B59F|nr:GH1 family beta-glucosidase [Goodfellowiella coeruleoviolacea]
MTFPTNFVWGAATAAFQIEGSTTVDGRTDSIWDTFCRVPGAVVNGDTGEPAVDHYRRMREDVRLMADLGLPAYRFSVAWPRVRPDAGPVNSAGLDFYERLVDTLLEHDITPWVTLYHWDLPQTLEDQGGWANRETAYRFAEYAESVLVRLGDRVSNWTTLNEPYCSAFLGYGNGVHAPGRTDPRATVAAVHHLLLAHGLGLAAIRAHAPNASAGVTVNLYPVRPADPDSPEDVEVARRVDGLQNRIFLDPLLRGAYPEDVLADLEPFGLADHIAASDLQTISAPLDLLGVNYYTVHNVTARPEPTDRQNTDRPSEWLGVETIGFRGLNRPRTAMDWEVHPDGLTEVLLRLNREYPKIPLYITENGAAYHDSVVDGGIHDPDRVAFLDGHLRAAHAALSAGVDLRGYFCWSLLDNFEWAEGYAKRFGIVHVDYETQVRTPKLSARWYSQVVRDNGLPAAENL